MSSPVEPNLGREYELKNMLKNYDLTTLEIDVYVGLLQQGGSKAKALSERLAINRVDIYRVLKRLALRGLVSTSESGPAIYGAVEPKVALKVLIAEVESRVRKLRGLAPEVLLELETIQQIPTKISNYDSPIFKIFRGEAAVEAVTDAVASAKDHIMGVWSLRRMYSYGMIDSFFDALKKGISAQIICEVTKENITEAEELSAMTSIRHCPGIEHSLRFTIVDGKALILGVAIVDSKIESHMNILSTNRNLIELVTRQFQILWDESVSPREFPFTKS